MQKTWVERACRNMALSQNRDIALWRISSLEILLLLPGKLFLLAQGLRAQEYLRPDLSAMGVCIGVCVCKRDVRVCVCVSICSHIYLHVCTHVSACVCVHRIQVEESCNLCQHESSTGGESVAYPSHLSLLFLLNRRGESEK